MLSEYEIYNDLKKSLNFLEIDPNYLYIKFITPLNKRLLLEINKGEKSSTFDDLLELEINNNNAENSFRNNKYLQREFE